MTNQAATLTLQTTEISTLTSFSVGSSYFMRSPCDHECVWSYTVTSRAGQTVTLKDTSSSKVLKCRIKVWHGVETCKPLGSYSMAPMLSADREVG